MDSELAAAGGDELDSHWEACAICRGRVSELRAEAEQVEREMSVLAPVQPKIDAEEAYQKLARRVAESGDKGRFRWRVRARLQGWRVPAGSAVAAAVAMAVLFSFAPARSWGQKILDMLRVQKVAVVPVDLSALNLEGKGETPAGKLLSQMISDSTVVTLKPGKAEVMPDRETASRLAGFTVRSLGELGSPQRISVQGEGAFHLTLDRERMLDLLEQAGRSDIQIPESVDGSTIAVHIPKMVHLNYGNCGSGPEPERGSDCVMFAELPSPIVSVPPKLNISALAEAGLQIGGMSTREAKEFCKTVDWSSTLLIPVPQRNSSSRVVSVDGVSGTLIETTPRGRYRGEYSLIWVKSGIVYAVNGAGPADRALAAAQSID